MIEKIFAKFVKAYSIRKFSDTASILSLRAGIGGARIGRVSANKKRG